MRRAFSIFALSILAAAGSIAQTYSITDLGTLGGPTSVANDIGSLGQIVGVSKHAHFDDDGFLYNNVTMHDLGTLGGVDSTVHGINSIAQITGHAYNAGGDFLAFLWQSGMISTLGTLGGDWSKGFDINDA